VFALGGKAEHVFHLRLIFLSGQTINLGQSRSIAICSGSQISVLRFSTARPEFATRAPQLSWASAQPGGLRVRLGFFNIAELGELLREPCRRAGLACRYRVTDGWHEVVIARPSVGS